MCLSYLRKARGGAWCGEVCRALCGVVRRAGCTAWCTGWRTFDHVIRHNRRQLALQVERRGPPLQPVAAEGHRQLEGAALPRVRLVPEATEARRYLADHVIGVVRDEVRELAVRSPANVSGPG